MNFARKGMIALGFVICLAVSSWAQMGRGMGSRLPHMPGEFRPEVGSGAQYTMNAKDQSMTFAYVVVGKEDVGGNQGYWMEIRTEGAGMPGETVMKQLVVLQGDKPDIRRMIMQAPGQAPMEMPMGMMSGMMKQGQQKSGGEEFAKAEKIGTETITVPGGTFVTEHYRSQSGKTPVDYWISMQVRPYGVVKMTSTEMTMVLKKTLTNETSHIKGEPQKMEMPHF
jgi:hypothetical protein